ncbi:Sec-independent protein translocase subunit TatA [Leifsonia sp. F6_8S_P_1B]|uniref:Sec-independent protein translocase protein TatA n=1 Tax=Leifsonia williamsii TaxID=3035919 RepID=A0ABT8KCZ9_9MICO|nr:Sec-independent protein translocase subunit TatA [Leifsonia williamsii]MDN4615340.1 Sec-independent protein translocase subunit TatA [Leifsonia williamsii]
MLGGLTGWHLLIILAVILLLFGAPKLPALAKSIGQSMRIFKGEVDELKKDGKSDNAAATTGDTTPGTATPGVAPAAPTGTDSSTESKPK